MNEATNHLIINRITKQLAADVEKSVEQKIESMFRSKQSSQSIANTKYSHRFTVRQDKGEIKFHIEAGKIERSAFFSYRISPDKKS